MSGHAAYGSLESWLATLPWTTRDEREATMSAISRGDLPMVYGLTAEESARHYQTLMRFYFDAETDYAKALDTRPRQNPDRVMRAIRRARVAA